MLTPRLALALGQQRRASAAARSKDASPAQQSRALHRHKAPTRPVSKSVPESAAAGRERGRVRLPPSPLPHTNGCQENKNEKIKEKKDKKGGEPQSREEEPSSRAPKLPARGDGGSTATTRCDMAGVQKWGVRGAAVPTGGPYLSGPQRPAPLRNWATE